jgi:hypothetical protein
VSELIKLRNERLQKQQEEAERAKKIEKPALKPRAKPAPKPKVIKHDEPVQDVKKPNIDFYRGLYQASSPDHQGAKEKFTDGQKATLQALKRRVKGLLLTPDGMHTFLNYLNEHVFSEEAFDQ